MALTALGLCTGRTAHMGSRGIALPFRDHGTRRGRGVSVTPRPLFTPPAKDPLPIIQEAWWAPGSVWTGAENLAPTGIRFPDSPARSQSLYQLRYLGPHNVIYQCWYPKMHTKKLQSCIIFGQPTYSLCAVQLLLSSSSSSSSISYTAQPVASNKAVWTQWRKAWRIFYNVSTHSIDIYTDKNMWRSQTKYFNFYDNILQL
jgi:hypothetical protein